MTGPPARNAPIPDSAPAPTISGREHAAVHAMRTTAVAIPPVLASWPESWARECARGVRTRCHFSIRSGTFGAVQAQETPEQGSPGHKDLTSAPRGPCAPRLPAVRRASPAAGFAGGSARAGGRPLRRRCARHRCSRRSRMHRRVPGSRRGDAQMIPITGYPKYVHHKSRTVKLTNPNKVHPISGLTRPSATDEGGKAAERMGDDGRPRLARRIHPVWARGTTRRSRGVRPARAIPRRAE